MTYNILWPWMRWPGRYTIEEASVGEGVTTHFVDTPENVSDQQWATCDGIISAPQPLPAEDIGKLERCRILVTPKVGFDNIDVASFGAAGIPVCNVPDYGTADVADHAMGLLLGLMKGINRYDARYRAAPQSDLGRHQFDHPVALRLCEARLGIVGLGRIGTAVALRAKAFGMHVAFHDPYVSNGSDLALGVSRVDTLEELVATSDILSLHAPLTAETTNLINADILAKAKKGMVLINAARGEIVDTVALHAALKSDQIGAAGLDVLPVEPPDMNDPLVAAWASEEDWIRDRVIITPHSGFYTPQSVYDMRYKGGEVAMKYLRTGRLENCVNAEHLVNPR